VCVCVCECVCVCVLGEQTEGALVRERVSGERPCHGHGVRMGVRVLVIGTQFSA